MIWCKDTLEVELASAKAPRQAQACISGPGQERVRLLFRTKYPLAKPFGEGSQVAVTTKAGSREQLQEKPTGLTGVGFKLSAAGCTCPKTPRWWERVASPSLHPRQGEAQSQESWPCLKVSV